MEKHNLHIADYIHIYIKYIVFQKVFEKGLQRHNTNKINTINKKQLVYSVGDAFVLNLCRSLMTQRVC